MTNKRHLLVVEDDIGLRDALVETLEIAEFHVDHATDGSAALLLIDKNSYDLVITDVQMEPMDGHTLLATLKKNPLSPPVLMMTAHGDIAQAVDAMRTGALDYLVKPFDACLLEEKVKACLPGSSGDNNEYMAVDKRSKELLSLAQRVAVSEATILITGESGSGKEVLARYIHRASKRHDKPFVAINCAAIPENMLEAILFGYEKGAFTGAYQAMPGKFEQAQGGTLFLDEVAEMDLGLQAKLLRVLQEKEVERLGSRKMVKLEVRVLAATNHSLHKLINEGKFREDLFYRLNVFPLHIPSLRERVKDIIPLSESILEKHATLEGRAVPVLDETAVQLLNTYQWPGNVRELDNALQRALILQPGHTICAADIQLDLGLSEKGDSPEEETESLGDDLKSREQTLIIEALSQGRGSRKYAAEKLGISPRTLRYKLAQMRDQGISIPG